MAVKVVALVDTKGASARARLPSASLSPRRMRA